MLKIFQKLFISIFLIAVIPTAYAQENLAKNNQQDLTKVSNYLQNIKYLTSSFIQEAPDGSIASGKFYLSRPGKMRVEYDSSVNVLIVVNDSILTYKDIELEEISRLRTNSTPASFLTRKNISFFAKDVQITKYKKENGIILVSLIKKNKPEAGEFTLVFQENPMKFLRMEVKDDLQQVTTVKLIDHDFKSKIDNNLFIIEE